MIPAWLGINSGATNVVSDPYFSSVVQLAHFDGTNGSTTYTNSCPRGNTLANGQNTSLNTSAKQWGTASVRASGINSWVHAASHADYNFSTSDWTIEFWVNPDNLLLNSGSNAKVYYDMRDTSLTAAWLPTISANNGTGNLRYFANGAQRIAGADVMVATTWNYVALCRNSGTTRLFHGVAGGNATQVGSNFTDSNTYVQGGITLTAAGNFGSGAPGGSTAMYIDDLRVTNGVGRYTTTFLVPTQAFPNQ